MRAVVQRVSRARVTVGNQVAGDIGPGLLVLLGIANQDAEADADYLAAKIIGLRIFEDAAGKMNQAVQEVDGSVLWFPSSRSTETYVKASGPRSMLPLHPKKRAPFTSILSNASVLRAYAAKRESFRR